MAVKAQPEPLPYGGFRAADFTGRVAAPAYRPTIMTDRLVLRPIRPGDEDDIVAGIGDLAVSRNLARVPHPYSRQNAEDYVGFAVRNAVTKRALISAITLDDRLIGVVSIDVVPQRNRLGYWLASRHWGRGYATEAVRAALGYLFATAPARLARAGVFIDNPASLRVLAKLGFRPVRRLVSRPLARGVFVEHIATVLPRGRFLDLNP